MTDVALYGHLTFDHISARTHMFEMGGIANVWRSLMRIDPALNVKVYPLMIGSSLIVINDNQKQNFSNLNQAPVKSPVTEAKISHIAYINELPYPEIVFQIQGFLTGDICTTNTDQGTPLKKEIAERFDVIFVSKEDLSLIPDTYSKRLVVHDPKGASVYTGSDSRIGNWQGGSWQTSPGASDHCISQGASEGKICQINPTKAEPILESRAVYTSRTQVASCLNPEEYLEDINVLGAGDCFAAHYIYKLLQGKSDAICIEAAQRMTTKFLKERHEKT